MRRIFTLNKFLWALNIAVILGLLFSILSFCSPLEKYVILSFLGLLVPILFVLNTFFFFYWIKSSKRKSAFILIIQIVVFICYGPMFGFHRNANTISNPNSDLSILTFNVRGLNHNEQLPIQHVDSAIYDFVIGENPDIFCVQESHRSMKKEGPLDKIYPFKFVDFTHGVPATNVVNSVYSKYPIISKKVLNFPKSNNTALFVDILKEKDTIRIYNIHLQSFRVPSDVNYLQSEKSSILYNRITRAIQLQEQQANIILEDIKSCSYPIVIVGDLNNIQFSKVYRAFNKNYNDSFIMAGSGMGRTIEVLGFPFRIDYIFADENFEIFSHTNYNIELSDHFPVMAHMRLKSHK